LVLGFAKLALLLIMFCVARAEAQNTVPEPPGFWTGPMSGAVPATISGGTVIKTTELAGLIGVKHPVLVDVGPMPHKPENIALEAWAPPPHRTIPGSVWLPGVGAGELPPIVDDWYRARLKELSGGDQSKPLVIFCHPDCWGSWNAAKRAILYGYTNVHWYEEGIEGWQDAGYETQVVKPELPPQ
jgi:PQQ-dependent catabolism-associated CXXCW motif protein